MASFSLSNSKRDLWEKHHKQKEHMKDVAYLSKANIWKSSLHEKAYTSHNKKIKKSVPNGVTQTGLDSRWTTPRKKYQSPEKRHVHASKHVSPAKKSPKEKGINNKKNSPKAMNDNEKLKRIKKKNSTFGSTPRAPNHSPGVILGDGTVLVSKPYNGFDGGKAGQVTRDINWKVALLAPNTYNVQDPRSSWIKPTFNKNIQKQMKVYKKKPHVKLPRRRLANKKEVERRFDTLGIPVDKLHHDPQYDDNDTNDNDDEQSLEYNNAIIEDDGTEEAILMAATEKSLTIT